MSEANTSEYAPSNVVHQSENGKYIRVLAERPGEFMNLMDSIQELISDRGLYLERCIHARLDEQKDERLIDIYLRESTNNVRPAGPQPAQSKEHDPVNFPAHYMGHPSGVEAIQVAEHMSFCAGNALKYIWRHDRKGKPSEDLRKAAWYCTREADRLERENGGDK